MKKLLFYSDYYQIPTGYGRIARNILPGLAENYDVKLIPLQEGYMGKTSENSEYPCVKRFGNTQWWEHELEREIMEWEPDIVFTCHDWLTIAPVISKYIQEPRKFCHVNYSCLEFEPVPNDYIGIIHKADRLIPMTQFCEDTLRKAYPLHKCNLSNYIYPPVDSKFFEVPLKTLNEGIKQLNGKKLIMCVAKNIERKNLPALCEAFKYIEAEHPDEYILFICQMPVKLEPGKMPHDLGRYRDMFGLKDMRYTDLSNPTVDEVLNEFYNIASCVVLSSQCEGIGLPLMEAAYIGTPVVAPNYSGMGEMARKFGYAVDDYSPIYHTQGGMKFVIVNPRSLASKIVAACELKKKRHSELHIDREVIWVKLIKEIEIGYNNFKQNQGCEVWTAPVFARQSL